MLQISASASSIPLQRERTAWPRDAAKQLHETPPDDHLRRAVLHQRLQQPGSAEVELIASLQCQATVAARALALELLRGVHQGHPDQPIPELQGFQSNLQARDQVAITKFLDEWPAHLNSPEALELRSLGLKALGRYQEASAQLAQLLSECCGSALAWTKTLELNYLERRSSGLALATALRMHPRDPGVATHRVLIELNLRLPGLARRSAFKERLLYSLGKNCPSCHQSDANLLYAYDHTGCSHLTGWLHPSLRVRLKHSPPLHVNLLMQLASVSSTLYGPEAEAHAAGFPSRHVKPPRKGARQLRVGLISPDLHYHPVGRFIQMLMGAGLGQEGELHLISTGQKALPKLQELAGGLYHDLAPLPSEQRLIHINSLDLDVAVDLAGWTGENNGFLFASGLAPVQVNYLGYFASNGLPAMDAWLGDAALFPDPMREWHSERIVRLERPFLAWQPDESLPEGRAVVPLAPTGPIHFGCFNHVRKLSEPTLRLWSQLLKAIPGARLALKAFASDDPAVMALLNRRMWRCGLDPEAVIWLPTCPRPEDHLRQYGLIDIALDPFPNGGCTTTCEALWMGVPVITLCGSHYVSRMATAVLQGANLGEWVAYSEDQYLQLGIQAAKRLDAIRAGRRQLRAQLQASPLGDASDLARQLWQCFEQLVCAC